MPKNKNKPNTKNAFRSVWTRGKSALLMAGGFGVFIAGGQLTLFALGIIVQIMMYKEITGIGLKKYNRERAFASLHWYWFCAALFYFNGRLFLHDLIKNQIIDKHFIRFSRYHLSISYALLILGVVLFVTTLKKPFYMKQFKSLSLCIAALFFIHAQIFLFHKMLCNGSVWVIIPITLICVNDTSAYFIGKLLGKTPLTKLSPNKTLEGFLGAAFVTSVAAPFIASFASRFDVLICPTKGILLQTFPCARDSIYLKEEYLIYLPKLPRWIYNLASPVLQDFLRMPHSIYLSGFEIHYFFIGLMISFVGPFGGFLASGFKRAFQLKDFGDTIPGHGGFTDRLDCLPLVAIVVFFYKHTFMNITEMDAEHVFSHFLKLTDSDKMELFKMVQNYIDPNTNA